MTVQQTHMKFKQLFPPLFTCIMLDFKSPSHILLFPMTPAPLIAQAGLWSRETLALCTEGSCSQ